MFLDVINVMAKELSQEFLQQVQFVQIGSFELVNRVLGESLKELSREVATETYQEECRKVEEKRLAEQRKLEHERCVSRKFKKGICCGQCCHDVHR